MENKRLACVLSAFICVYLRPIAFSRNLLDPYAESRPYAIGPTVEVRLPAGFAIEASALYRRLGQTTAFNYRDLLNGNAT